jgi:hypothetical protein
MFFNNFNLFYSKKSIWKNDIIFEKLVKLDIKLNFWLNLIIKYNNLEKSKIYELYEFIWENIDLNLTKFNAEFINDKFPNLITNIEQYNIIIKNWFQYISFSRKIYKKNNKNILLLYTVCAPNLLSFEDLAVDVINKDKFILQYINLNMYEGIFDLIDERT